MRVFLIAAALLLAAPAAARAADPSLWSRDLPLGAAGLPPALGSERPFDLVGVHWRGSGRVELRTRGGPGSGAPGVTAAPEAEDRPDRGASERSRAGWKVGQPVVGSRLDAPGSAHLRPSDPSARLVRPQPVRAGPPAHAGDCGLAEDRPSSAWNANEKIVRGRAALCADAAVRHRSPHRRRQLVRARGIRSDRPRHRALPREGQRLERHRLQLPRRPLRPGLRGPRRRDAAQRHRRARRGFQHRFRRRRRPRHVFGEGTDARGGRRSRRAARVAAGRRSCRSRVVGDGLVRSAGAGRISVPSPGIGMPAPRPVLATRCTRGSDNCERWR